MRFFIIVAAFFSLSLAITASADTIATAAHKQGTKVTITGELGGAAEGLFHAFAFLNQDPGFPPYEQKEYRGANYHAKTWIADEEAMDSDQFNVELVIDGKASAIAIARSGNTAQLTGELALSVLRGMWLMSVDYPENYTITRTKRHGEFEISDQLTRQLSCRKVYERPSPNESERLVASCTLAGVSPAK